MIWVRKSHWTLLSDLRVLLVTYLLLFWIFFDFFKRSLFYIWLVVLDVLVALHVSVILDFLIIILILLMHCYCSILWYDFKFIAPAVSRLRLRLG